MSDYTDTGEYVSTETTLSSEGIATTVYLHTGGDAIILSEYWTTWDELDVDPDGTPRESITSDMHGLANAPEVA